MLALAIPAAAQDSQATQSAETSFKLHASCRHTHPAADALLQVVSAYDLAPEDILRVVAHVHQGAIDVLGPVVEPRNVHQAKFSMGTVLGLIAHFRAAGLGEFDAHFNDPRIAEFRGKVFMELDREIDAAYPARWRGRVTVETRDGRVLTACVDHPKSDPGNTLSRPEIEKKAHGLAAFAGGATAAEMNIAIARFWNLDSVAPIGRLLPAAGPGIPAPRRG